MSKQIKKLEKLVKQHLHKTRNRIIQDFGDPNKDSNDEIWFYYRCNWLIYKEEIGFIFEDDMVIDIILSESVFGRDIRNTYFFEGQNPEYKVIRFF